jgi:hypothetical protein
LRREAPGFVRVDFERREVRCFDLRGGEVLEVAPLALPEPLPLG